jgi:hypothetical protein
LSDHEKRSRMSIRQAQKSDFAIVKEITHTTIQTIYPNYYPPGAVAFFLHYHNDKSIAEDDIIPLE